MRWDREQDLSKKNVAYGRQGYSNSQLKEGGNDLKMSSTLISLINTLKQRRHS